VRPEVIAQPQAIFAVELLSLAVKRDVLPANPVAAMDRPPHRREPPQQVPTPALTDALIAVAQPRQWPRNSAMGWAFTCGAL
jgi:hypothetical protein